MSLRSKPPVGLACATPLSVLVAAARCASRALGGLLALLLNIFIHAET